MTNTIEFKVEMLRQNFSTKDLAELLDLSRVSTSKKINNDVPFSLQEVDIISTAWNLSAERKDELFFYKRGWQNANY